MSEATFDVRDLPRSYTHPAMSRHTPPYLVYPSYLATHKHLTSTVKTHEQQCATGTVR